MKTVVAVIQARNGSTRLPNKASLLLDGQPILAHVISRVRSAIENVVVATTLNREDDEIQNICNYMGVDCYRGNQDDVLHRIKMAATSYLPSSVVRICADQPLINSALLKEGIAIHLRGDKDFSTTKGMVLSGMDFEIINYNILEQIDKEDLSESEREHVTTYILSHPDIYSIEYLDFGDDFKRPDIKLTLDTTDDYLFIQSAYFESEGAGDINRVIEAIDDGLVYKRPPLILLRADGSKEMGMGNVISVINIAESLKPYFNFVFAGQSGCDYAKKRGYDVFDLAEFKGDQQAELNAIRTFCNERKIYYCISYQYSSSYIEELSSFLKVLAIDPRAREGMAVVSDMFLSFSFFAEKSEYKIINKKTKLLLGPDYIPLGLRNKKTHFKRNELKEILVTFGGSDPNNRTIAILNHLPKEYNYRFIIGSHYPYRMHFLDLVRDRKNISVLDFSEDNFELFANSDLVICGGGLTALELLALGVPFIGISQLPWEKRRLQYLDSQGYCKYVDNLKSLPSVINKLKSADKREQLTSSLVDGKGCERIASEIRKRWLNGKNNR